MQRPASLLPAACLPALLCGLGAAHADSELPAVTVTANKSAQSLEKVAGSVSAFVGDDLAISGARGLEDVARMTPGLSFQSMGQSGLLPPVMRGLTGNVASFSASSVLVVDGVPTLRAQGFDHGLLGVERVEVLRGPQSTLYGRNAEAGVIQVLTRQPGNDPYLAIGAEVGSRQRQSLKIDASRALIANQLYLGVAGETLRQGGFIDNGARQRRDDDREQYSGRLALRWTPDAATDITLRYGAHSWHDGASQWGSVSAGRASVRSGTDSFNQSLSRTLSLDVAHTLDNGWKLRAITARSEFADRVQQDTDYTPSPLLYVARDHRFDTLSQEIRLEGRLGAAQWLAGVYADRDDHTLRFGQKTPMAFSAVTASQRGNTHAAFTHWQWPLGGAWSVLAGARLEHSDTRFQLNGDAGRSQQSTHVSPKLALQYQWRPDSQVYASLSEGFRAGGFNAFAPDSARRYEPETVRAAEIGVRGQALDRRLRYALSVYAMDVRDMQVQQMPAAGLAYISNAASARANGLEAELQWLLGGGWRLHAALGVNSTRFRRFQDGANRHDGKHNPYAPDLTGELGVRYEDARGWRLGASVNGVSKVYLDAANRYQQPGYGLIHLDAAYTLGDVELSAYVRNAANKRYDAVGFLNGSTVIYSPPREIGLRLNWRL